MTKTKVAKALASTENSLVTLDREDGIAIVTLNRPEAMNALSSALRAKPMLMGASLLRGTTY